MFGTMFTRRVDDDDDGGVGGEGVARCNSFVTPHNTQTCECIRTRTTIRAHTQTQIGPRLYLHLCVSTTEREQDSDIAPNDCTHNTASSSSRRRDVARKALRRSGGACSRACILVYDQSRATNASACADIFSRNRCEIE